MRNTALLLLGVLGCSPLGPYGGTVAADAGAGGAGAKDAGTGGEGLADADSGRPLDASLPTGSFLLAFAEEPTVVDVTVGNDQPSPCGFAWGGTEVRLAIRRDRESQAYVADVTRRWGHQTCRNRPVDVDGLMVRIDVGGGGTLIAHSKCPGAMLCEATESLWDLTLMLDGHGGLAADAAGVLWHSCQEDDVVDYVAHLTWPALLSADQEAPDVRPEWPASGGPAYGVPFLPWELARLAASEPVNQGELLSGIRFVPDGAPPVVHRWLDAGAGGATMGEFFAFESWDAVGGHTLAIQAGPQGLSDGAGNVATGVLSELSVLGVGEPVAGCDFDGPASIGYWGPVSFAAPGSSEAAELCEQGGCAVLGPLELNPCGPMAPKGAGIALRIATGGAKSVRVRYRGQSTPGEQSTVDFGLVYPLTDDGMIKGALASVEPVPEWADAILPVQDGQIEAGLVIAPHVYWCFPPPPPSITATVVIDRIVVE